MEPLPPSDRVPFEIAPDLEALIMACLAKDPDQRPASARDLMARLEALDVSEPWTPQRAETWWREYGDVSPEPPTVKLEEAVLITKHA